ncbi:hypothetical protein [Endozoicomonas sp. SCSIO W0465]|uniref:hypothetical protein n=1 Tax=Endozoicomonas sp. SCSIO W0465 TaxID=2918516 RepID=UPI0020761547|nr:hypothetical protein [Endozoicomonas sp. SCSIO W0465]USE37554.1 hypothetical protein MJO57_04900 [Endozoicomonas sp. SCSIO W0465]
MPGRNSQFNHQWFLVGTLMHLSMLSQADTVDPGENYEVLSLTLNELLTALCIAHDSTLESMIDTSQIWRRKPGQERWELPALNISTSQVDRAFDLLETLGLISPIAPLIKQYDYALLLGSTAPGMKRRLDYITDWWSQGVRFKRLIFLVGQRPLTPGADYLDILKRQPDKNLDPFPFTETEAAIMLHQLVPMPEAIRAVPVEFIDTPRNWRNGFWHRPNTRDTLKHWLKADPIPGAALVISDQPHGVYQKEVVRQELPGFVIDLMAGPADPAATLPVYLDALALWLYNLKPFIPQSALQRQ